MCRARHHLPLALCLAIAACKPETKVSRLVENLGIETTGDTFFVLLPAGAPLPASFEKTFSAELTPAFKLRIISGVGVSAASARTVLDVNLPRERLTDSADIELKLNVSESGKARVHIQQAASSGSFDRDDLQLAVGR